jgi:hypothetical protein
MGMCIEFSFMGMLIYEIIWVLYSTNKWNLLASSWNTNVKNIFDVMVYKKNLHEFHSWNDWKSWVITVIFQTTETTKNWSNYKQVNIIIPF